MEGSHKIAHNVQTHPCAMWRKVQKAHNATFQWIRGVQTIISTIGAIEWMH